MEIDQQWMDENQDLICEYCEAFVMEAGEVNCEEGYYCEAATEKYIEALEDLEEDANLDLLTSKLKVEVDIEELKGLINAILNTKNEKS